MMTSESIRKTLNFVEATKANFPLMRGVMAYLEGMRHHVTIIETSPEANLPLLSRRDDGIYRIIVSVAENTKHAHIAGQLAQAAKQIYQRQRNQDLFLWDNFSKAVGTLTPEQAARERILLSPITDAVLLNVALRTDAAVFGEMVSHELRYEPVSQVLNSQAHLAHLMARNNELASAVRSELNHISAALDKLDDKRFPQKPVAKITPLSTYDIADICKGLWTSNVNLSSPFVTNADVAKQVEHLRSWIAEYPQTAEVREHAENSFKKPPVFFFRKLTL